MFKKCFKNFTKILQQEIKEKERLDIYIKKISSLNWGQVQSNIKKKSIRVFSSGNYISDNKYRLKKKDKIFFDDDLEDFFTINKKLKNLPKSEFSAELVKYMLIEENQNFLVLNKLCGINSQDGESKSINIIQLLDSYFQSIREPFKARIVHRLDLPVSGVLFVAKNLEYTQKLGKIFQTRQIQKYYTALLQGIPSIDLIQNCLEGMTVKQFIGFNKNKGVAYMVDSQANKSLALTETHIQIKYIYLYNKQDQKFIKYLPKQIKLNLQHFQQNEAINFYTEIEYKLVTGKKHQLRVLSKQILKCPILFDFKYGYKKNDHSPENYIHEKITTNSFKFSQLENVQNYLQNAYTNKDYIYLHCNQSIIKSFYDSSNKYIQYNAQQPIHIDMFKSLFK